MGARIETRKIGEVEYTVTQFPPTISVPLQIELVSLVLPVIGPMLKDAGTSSDSMSEALRALGTTLATQMPGPKFLELAQRLVINDHVRTSTGNRVVFESAFMGDDAIDLYLLIGFVLEVNFAGFFSGSGGGKVGAMLRGLAP